MKASSNTLSKVLFISDLHLDPKRSDIQSYFDQFINTCIHDNAQPQKNIQALYILGDLFEVWMGDDASIPIYQHSITQLKQLVNSGTELYIMRGNRDFLMGADFARASGATLIADPYPITLTIEHQKQAVLLSHGDIFCTDDQPYMDFRRLVRDPLWQQQFLAKPITERIAIARAMRENSIKSQSAITTDTEISDVNQDTLEHIMLTHQCQTLIHGHTHRPAVHQFYLHNKNAQRIVLSDWYSNKKNLWSDDEITKKFVQKFDSLPN
ncbi:MAG: UDP-2,3-diacylglucosamine diphosphatase [Gammaproteobacteria bacterium]|nr:UDP-2,3-diacylglucosamine diphosphatase [Gammaproteobacteria bacterium]